MGKKGRQMGKKTISLDREVLNFTLFLFAVKGSEEEKKERIILFTFYFSFFIFYLIQFLEKCG